jgi:hypothetical protein
MVNGTAARLPCASEPALAHANAPTALEQQIGAAVAAGVEALAMAISDCAAEGAMSSFTRAWGGAMLGRVAEMQLGYFGQVDFAVIAVREGRRALLDPGRVIPVHPAAVDELVGHVITIADKIVATERTLAN